MRRCSVLAILLVAACSGGAGVPLPPVDPTPTPSPTPCPTPTARPLEWYVELVEPMGPSERETFDTMEAAQAKVDEWAPGSTTRLVMMPDGVRLMEWFFVRQPGGGYVRAFSWDRARDLPSPIPRVDWPPIEETPAQ